MILYLRTPVKTIHGVCMLIEEFDGDGECVSLSMVYVG